MKRGHYVILVSLAAVLIFAGLVLVAFNLMMVRAMLAEVW